MSVELRDVMMQHLDVVRHEPIGRRIRAVLDDPTVVDSSRALLVWEPKRVPSYAIPIEDVAGDLVKAESAGWATSTSSPPQMVGRRVYDPSIPFAVHTTEGTPLVVRVDGALQERAITPWSPRRRER